MQFFFDSDSLIHWFQEVRRDLPWRKQVSPYAVWVSEVMLQQTQVSVVIPYFEKWMIRFPSIEELSRASLDEVIKLWEGLGYYSRARNLLEGAKTVCKHFDGELPCEEKKLALIKGLGPYTIGAIRSFAFHQKTAAVDGNVLRVIARYCQIAEDISKASTCKHIRQKVEELLPEERHWIVNEALIELGATVCMKKPKCSICPLQRGCQSFRHGKTQELPFKSKGAQTIPLYRATVVICYANMFLIKRESGEKLMQDLHEFPYFETGIDGISKDELLLKISNAFGLNVQWQGSFDRILHSFTKYRIRLQPELFLALDKMDIAGYSWKTQEEMFRLAFSAGHRKVLEELRSKSLRYL